MTARSPDAVVVGGGVIGCVIAWELAQRGLAVTVLERGTPGRAATWAAGGMLSPLAETAHHSEFFRLAVASLDRWPAFAQRLRRTTGTDVEFRPAGKLHVAFTAFDVTTLQSMHARGNGFGVDLLSAAEARALEPALAPDITAALLVGRDHRVNTRVLGETTWRAAEAAGARVQSGAPAQGIELRGPQGRRHVAAIMLADGTTLHSALAVIAAGAWSAALHGLPRPLPVEPVRGQMFAVEPAEPLFAHVIEAPGCYLIPRESGRLLVGATSEHVGFEPGPTPASIGALRQAAVRVAPAIAQLPIAESWAGFRPGTPDELPIIGADPTVNGLFYATGHYRNGVLLAPVTGEIIAGLVTAGSSPLPIDAFRVDRFGGADGR
jgi:glycine oxidase